MRIMRHCPLTPADSHKGKKGKKRDVKRFHCHKKAVQLERPSVGGNAMATKTEDLSRRARRETRATRRKRKVARKLMLLPARAPNPRLMLGPSLKKWRILRKCRFWKSGARTVNKASYMIWGHRDMCPLSVSPSRRTTGKRLTLARFLQPTIKSSTLSAWEISRSKYPMEVFCQGLRDVLRASDLGLTVVRLVKLLKRGF
jgi:hypothetical protein